MAVLASVVVKPCAVVIVTFICLSCIFKAESVSLDSDGFYNIVIAINEKTAQNDNEEYLQNLKLGIQDLSDAIFESTREKFSIRSADIILPNHWKTEADAFVTSQTYKNADFRISHEYSVPQAINPTFCGYPGRYIELPYNIFDKPDTGPYGPTGKALLTLWARYRWGVFEEHGFPGDSIFPYFWKEWAPWNPLEPPIPEPWKVTSCANTVVKGTYKTPTGEECDLPDPPVTTEDPETTTTLSTDTAEIASSLSQDDNDSGLYPPSSNCRFYPDIYNQTVTSSLMSFQMIQSLLDFCDNTTHDKMAPTRQNLHCQFKSVWEVIRESMDWKRVTAENLKRAPIHFRILKKTEKPLLFILTEGVNMPPPRVISTLTSGLSKIFDKNEHWNVLAGVGVFPGKLIKDSFDIVYPWNTPWHNNQEFIESIQNSFGTRDNTTFRNFGAALQDIGNLIRDKEHDPGAVVIMIKYGTEVEDGLRKQWPAHEAEVIGAIAQQNIRLFVLEGHDDLANSTRVDSVALKNITEKFGGMHFKIGISTAENDGNVEKVLSQVEKILTDGNIPASKYRVAYKQTGIYSPYQTTEISIPMNYKNVGRLFFYYHDQSEPDLTNANTVQLIGITETEPITIDSDVYDQWGREGRYNTSFVNWTASGDPANDPTEWKCSILCVGSDCIGTVVVIAELSGEVTRSNNDDITIEIFTSAEDDNNTPDLTRESVASLKGVAFTIYAKLEKGGHPISNPEMEVVAHICHYLDGRTIPDDWYWEPPKTIVCQQAVLTDEGPSTGDPDLTANDGIFSGNYIPAMQMDPTLVDFRGTYQIFVTAGLAKSTAPQIMSAPLPVDQGSIRCGSGYSGCWNEHVTEPFFVYADLKTRIDFRGKEDYSQRELGAATRVLDLRISKNPIQGYDIIWTEPGVWLSTSVWRAEAYEIHFASSFEDLIQERFRDKVNGVPNPIQAKRSINVTVIDLEEGESRWYILKSVAKPTAPWSTWSNVLFVHVTPDYFSTTTTTTTTTTPAPTSSTTRLPTKEPGTTSIPTRVTTGHTTTRRHRPTSTSTTTESSTVTTSRTRATTSRIEITTPDTLRWYKSGEAIATLTIFSVGMVVIFVFVTVYLRIYNKG